ATGRPCRIGSPGSAGTGSGPGIGGISKLRTWVFSSLYRERTCASSYSGERPEFLELILRHETPIHRCLWGTKYVTPPALGLPTRRGGAPRAAEAIGCFQGFPAPPPWHGPCGSPWKADRPRRGSGFLTK